jgi:hypothetical protein
MMTKTEIDDALQVLRTLKVSQIRKQLEKDNKPSAPQHFDDITEEWVPRSVIITNFIRAAKEQL